MKHRSLVRALLTSVVLATGVVLAGCNGEDMSLASNAKANQPVPPKLVAEMTEKDMDLQSPMLVRVFKQEAELEVWKQNRSGQFALLKTYPICRWSGDLGPKVKEGDRQAPEGFYSITPAQMNPRSSYYLSFNTGFPNAFDKSLGRTGSQLMVHGDCSSRGCFAMTDEQIAEIYSLGRESFFGGQRSFQFAAFPFKMTPVNMAKHRNNPNMPFWKMIKQGYDHFEVTRQEPKVEFCENKYVFDPAAPAGSTKPLVFNASAKCPVYQIPSEIADAVSAKQAQDDAKVAELIAKGTPVAQRRPDIDGGMNRVFAAKLPDASTGLSDPELPGMQTAAYSRAPGTIPPHVNPPKATAAATASYSASLFAASEEPVVAAPSTRVASASSDGGFFSNLAKKVGIGGSDTTATTTAAPPAAAPVPTPAAKPKAATAAKPAPAPAAVAAPKPAAAPAPVVAATPRPPLKPTLSAEPSAPASGGGAGTAALSGAAPVVSANSFSDRFSAMR
ncbi:L,D-transpeptidase family protein [Tardiphaga sp. 768_D3_N2_1]|uniref:L,D-transpeptidase family protein n=1 Tax=Tardiphaga sp. 768_D3_N2_1 TaxID=3240783 RepID=UPI003F890F12